MQGPVFASHRVSRSSLPDILPPPDALAKSSLAPTSSDAIGSSSLPRLPGSTTKPGHDRHPGGPGLFANDGGDGEERGQPSKRKSAMDAVFAALKRHLAFVGPGVIASVACKCCQAMWRAARTGLRQTSQMPCDHPGSSSRTSYKLARIETLTHTDLQISIPATGSRTWQPAPSSVTATSSSSSSPASWPSCSKSCRPASAACPITTSPSIAALRCMTDRVRTSSGTAGDCCTHSISCPKPE